MCDGVLWKGDYMGERNQSGVFVPHDYHDDVIVVLFTSGIGSGLVRDVSCFYGVTKELANQKRLHLITYSGS